MKKLWSSFNFAEKFIFVLGTSAVACGAIALMMLKIFETSEESTIYSPTEKEILENITELNDEGILEEYDYQ